MDIEKDDIIVMSSDGLYDNLTLHEIEKISQQVILFLTCLILNIEK